MAVLSRLRAPLSPGRYRTVTLGALVLLVAIVVTGAGVRLTGSGLGCTDWPNCTQDRFVAPLEWHPMIEFVNRVVTGLVSLAVAAAVLGSFRRVPRRRDLTWLSVGLVVGVIAQILVGRIVVVSDLNPWWVQMHMVVSLLLVLDAFVLYHRAGLPDDRPVRPAVSPGLLRWGWIVTGATAVVLLTGTLVTGSGPHSGHNEGDVTVIRRLPIAVHDAARIHGVVGIVFVAGLAAVLFQIRRHHGQGPLLRAAESLLTVSVLQAAIGYTQYFSGVPPLLVASHVLGSCLVWVAASSLLLRMRWPLGEPSDDSRSWGGEFVVDPVTGGDPVPGSR